jgi:hypothetical protein
MGFTRYYSHNMIPPTKNGWNNLLCFTKKCIEFSNISIKGPRGVDDPILTDTKISFNGDVSLGLSMDTFSLFNVGKRDTKKSFHLNLLNLNTMFCKTSKLPYDDVVTCVIKYATTIKILKANGWQSSSFDDEQECIKKLYNITIRNIKLDYYS